MNRHASYEIVDMLEDCDCSECNEYIAQINEAMEKLDEHLQDISQPWRIIRIQRVEKGQVK